jgi:hypothetical protein
MCASLHDRFLSLLPKIELHGQIFFRQLTAENRSESLQEMRALAWKWFRRLARRGKDAAEFLGTFNTYLARAIRCGRRVTGQEKSKDVMCVRTQRQHGFKVEPLPSTRSSHEHLYGDVHGQHEHDVLEELLRDNTITPVPDQAAFRIDWPAWMKTRAYRDRRIIEDLMAGQRTFDVAGKYGVSPARVSQLRREFQQDWERFCGATDAAELHNGGLHVQRHAG